MFSTVDQAVAGRGLDFVRQAGFEIPYRMATPQEIIDEAFKFTTKTEGLTILIRGKH